MFIMKNVKRQITEGIEMLNQLRIIMIGENYKYLRKVEADIIRQAEIKKEKKRVNQMNEKISRKQVL